MQFWVHALECTSKWGDNMGADFFRRTADMYIAHAAVMKESVQALEQ